MFVYLIVSKIIMFIEYYLTFYLRILIIVFLGIYGLIILKISLDLKCSLGDRRISTFWHFLRRFRRGLTILARVILCVRVVGTSIAC